VNAGHIYFILKQKGQKAIYIAARLRTNTIQ